MLPFFGPSTVRDAVGFGVDGLFDFRSYLLTPTQRSALGLGEGVVRREEVIDPVEFLVKHAVNHYDAVRAWEYQERQRELTGGCTELRYVICPAIRRGRVAASGGSVRVERSVAARITERDAGPVEAERDLQRRRRSQHVARMVRRQELEREKLEAIRDLAHIGVIATHQPAIDGSDVAQMGPRAVSAMPEPTRAVLRMIGRSPA